MIKKVQDLLKKNSNKEYAKKCLRFFKTGKGEYAEGDIFIGLRSPQIRSIVKSTWKEINLEELDFFLNSKIHEERYFSLLSLVEKYEKTKKKSEKIKYINFYLKNTKKINNWDLVDLSSYKILGNGIFKKYLQNKILYDLSHSENLWEKRISIVSTKYLINNWEFSEALKISEILINDKHDLIHKATGWMLREVGKKNEKLLLGFLDEFYGKMPRTMLRYSIEKLDCDLRVYYLKKK